MISLGVPSTVKLRPKAEGKPPKARETVLP